MTNLKNVLNYKCRSLSNCETYKTGVSNFLLLYCWGRGVRDYTRTSYAWSIHDILTCSFMSEEIKPTIGSDPALLTDNILASRDGFSSLVT